MSLHNLKGNWKGGWALDLHTVHSTQNDDGSFNNERTRLGESLYVLKYKNDYTKIDELAQEAAVFIQNLMVKPYLSVILPTPPSKTRHIQPVIEMAKKISEIIKIPIDLDYIHKIKNTEQIKSVQDLVQREKIMEGAFSVSDQRYANKKVLIFDDLFRSGTTLKEITRVLYEVGKVQNVYVVTLTKTRVNR
jgi:predicted amidophosphoribosyltransferase